MDVMSLRRAIIQAPTKFPLLKYWWCGDDAPVNNQWIDRVSGWAFTIYGDNVYNNDDKQYDFIESSQYATATKPNTPPGFSIGHHWIFKFDIWVNRYKSANATYFFDIGSVNSSSKAIGFGIGTRTNDSDAGAPYKILNWKMKGNSSNPFLGSTEMHPALPLQPMTEFVHAIGSYKMVDGGNGYDKFIATINGQTMHFTTNVPQVEYGPTWSPDILRMAQSAYNIGSYKASCKIKDIKFYVID